MIPKGMDYQELWSRNRVEWLYQLARCPDIGAPAVRVGLLFGTFFRAEDRESLRPGYDWLMKNAHMSRATVAKAIKELEAAGFLVVDRIHRYRSTYYMPFDGDAVWTLSSKIERY